MALFIPSIIAGMITPSHSTETIHHSVTPDRLRYLCACTAHSVNSHHAWTWTCQIYDNHNINNVAHSYLPFYMFHNFNILNILVHGNVFNEFNYWCSYANVFETPWEGILATQHMMYLLTAIGLTHSGSSTVHICTQTMHRTTQWNKIPRTEHTKQYKYLNKQKNT